ncbi:hypothetical protein SEA_BONUM_87 [Gordonia phage Bonum]|nr:hypothetical protein SEA_BONUM_87 [Gordonia phage Bonum]
MTHTLAVGDRVTVAVTAATAHLTGHSPRVGAHVFRVESVDRDTAVVTPDYPMLYTAPHQTVVAVADLAPVTHLFTVRRLSALNVRALREAEDAGYLTGVQSLGATVATFYGNTPADVIARLDIARDRLAAVWGTRGHPVASLPAVRRKLDRAARGEGDGAVSAVEIPTREISPHLREIPTDEQFYRAMSAGHRERTGHALTGHLASADGETWHIVRTCCGETVADTAIDAG